jgi:hypothetical protein
MAEIIKAQQGGFRTDIARLFKSEWAAIYAKACPICKAFTISSINGSWSGVGLNPFQRRKFFQRAQAISPSTTSTPPPEQNFYDNALSTSSPLDMQRIHNANQALHILFKKDSVLHSPEKNYIIRLDQKAERLQVRVALLQEQKKRSEEILSARRVMKSGRRLSVEGQHLLTTETVYEKVKNAEIMIEERKKKTGGRVERSPTK